MHRTCNVTLSTAQLDGAEHAFQCQHLGKYWPVSHEHAGGKALKNSIQKTEFEVKM